MIQCQTDFSFVSMYLSATHWYEINLVRLIFYDILFEQYFWKLLRRLYLNFVINVISWTEHDIF